MNIQGWFPLGLTVLISLQSTGLSRVFSTTIWKHQFFGAQPSVWSSSFFMVQLLHLYLTIGKTIALAIGTSVCKVMSLLSRLVIAFLPRSKHLLILWLQSPSAVILEPKKIKSVTLSIYPPSIYHEVMGPDAMIFIFCMLSFKPTFSLSTLTFIKRLFSSSSLSAGDVICISEVIDISPFNLDPSLCFIQSSVSHACTLHIS